MYANHRHFRVYMEIGVKEHDGDVRFNSKSGNMTISCMRNNSAIWAQAQPDGGAREYMTPKYNIIPFPDEITKRILGRGLYPSSLRV